MTRTGGRILIDQLAAQGAELMFGVPGESYLPALDALVDVPQLRFITCRQEGGAAMMAEAYGKLTGQPGLCFVTRGPGATNAAAGLHVAMQDSTPMILLIGQVGLDCKDREAFQEIEYREMFAPVAKWVAEITDPARIPEYVARAYTTALQGRPGPVVLVFPEEVLSRTADVKDAPKVTPAYSAPRAQDMATLTEWLTSAQRPLLILGGGGWNSEAHDHIRRFAENCRLPVLTTFRRQDAFDNEHSNYGGELGLGANPKLVERVKQSDLLIMVGARLGENPSQGYTLLDIPSPTQKLVHVHPGAAELGKVYHAALPILSNSLEFAKSAAQLSFKGPENRAAWLKEGRAIYEAWQQPVPQSVPVNMSEIMCDLRNLLPETAIFTNGAGNYAAWLHRFHRYRPGTQLAPTSGSMGYGVPAAVAAKLTAPECVVVNFSGDGCFLMHGQELATAVQHKAGIVFIVVNNSSYGTIRMHQERHYPGRVSATDLRNPDFVALAKAYGAEGIRVTETAQFAPALRAALNHTLSGSPALIEIVLDVDAITPRQTLTQIRAAALAT
jgi:acetolactate synthase-1/2/3 large subunit